MMSLSSVGKLVALKEESSSSAFIFCTSHKRSRLILASWPRRIKVTIWRKGTFICPMMNCTASIIPRVICPSITSLAVRIVIRISLSWLIKEAPAFWYWSMARDCKLMPNNLACISDHCQRLFRPLFCSLISCIP